MASSEMYGNDAGRTVESDLARYADQAAVELSAAEAREAGAEKQISRRLRGYRSHADRSRLIKEARETEFPIGLRGYERSAVDRYVTEVNRLIAELEMTSSPESAVRRALAEVSDETRSLLERAHQTAEEITSRSRVKADDRLKQAEGEAQALRAAAQQDAEAAREAAQREADGTREAAHREAHELRTAAQHEAAKLRELATAEVNELRETAKREVAELLETARREVSELRDTAAREAQQVRAGAQHEGDRVIGEARRECEELVDMAETRARELAQNAETIWRERRRLVDDMRAIGEQLTSIGEAEGKRFPRLSEAIPPVSVSSRMAAARQRANGGAEPQGANGGSDLTSAQQTPPAEAATGGDE